MRGSRKATQKDDEDVNLALDTLESTKTLEELSNPAELLKYCLSRDKKSAELLQLLMEEAQAFEGEGKAVLGRLTAEILPQALARYVDTLEIHLQGANRVRDEVPLDILTSQVALDEYYLKACKVMSLPLHEKLEVEPKLESPFAVPTTEALSTFVGQHRWCVPGVAPAVERQVDAPIEENHPDRGVLKETALNVKYGVAWKDQEKIIRDILQNFFDGHGRSLAGVEVVVSRQSVTEPFRVEIRGQGEYRHDLLIYIGGTTKALDEQSAGHFGEGSKIVPLVLLRSGVAESCHYRSRNWELQFELAEMTLERVKLCYRLNEVVDRPGNELILHTRDTSFIKALVDGLLLFRFPGHPDFAPAHLSNVAGGLQVLDMFERGNIYIGGQRYEIIAQDLPNQILATVPESDDDLTPREERSGWSNNLKGCSLWREKPLRTMGRDRRALTRDEIEEHVIAPLLHEATNAELMKLLMQLSPFWSVMAELKEIDHPVFRPLCREIRQRNIITNFPENYVALPRTHKGVNAEAVIDAIEKEGKVACRPIMASLGMNARHEREALEHVEVVKPEYSEARRILMLREGAQLLLEDLLTKEIFHRRDYTTFSINSDIATGVYVASETDVHIPTALYCGSAVLWNRDELVTKSYLEALAIHLHELTHVHGGDNQRIFTLEMSKWISIALRTMQSPELLLKICALEYMWDAEGRLSEEQRQQEQDDQDDD